MNIEDLISDYIDGSLSSEAESELHHRLAVSPEARKLFRAHIMLRGVARDQRVLHTPTQDMRARLFERLGKEEGMVLPAAVSAMEVPQSDQTAPSPEPLPRAAAPRDEVPRSLPSDALQGRSRRRRRVAPWLIPLVIAGLVFAVLWNVGREEGEKTRTFAGNVPDVPPAPAGSRGPGGHADGSFSTDQAATGSEVPAVAESATTGSAGSTAAGADAASSGDGIASDSRSGSASRSASGAGNVSRSRRGSIPEGASGASLGAGADDASSDHLARSSARDFSSNRDVRSTSPTRERRQDSRSQEIAESEGGQSIASATDHRVMNERMGSHSDGASRHIDSDRDVKPESSMRNEQPAMMAPPPAMNQSGPMMADDDIINGVEEGSPSLSADVTLAKGDAADMDTMATMAYKDEESMSSDASGKGRIASDLAFEENIQPSSSSSVAPTDSESFTLRNRHKADPPRPPSSPSVAPSLTSGERNMALDNPVVQSEVSVESGSDYDEAPVLSRQGVGLDSSATIVPQSKSPAKPKTLAADLQERKSSPAESKEAAADFDESRVQAQKSSSQEDNPLSPHAARGPVVVTGLQQNSLWSFAASKPSFQIVLRGGMEFDGGHQVYALIGAGSYREVTGIVTISGGNVVPGSSSTSAATRFDEIFGGAGYLYTITSSRSWRADAGVWGGAGNRYMRLGSDLHIIYLISRSFRIELVPNIQYARKLGTQSSTEITPITGTSRREQTRSLEQETDVNVGIGIGATISW